MPPPWRSTASSSWTPGGTTTTPRSTTARPSAASWLRALRQGTDVLGLAEALHTGLHRHLPDLSDGSLYDTAFAGTKRIVDDVLTEVEKSIAWLAEVPLPPELDAERLHSFRMQRRAFGRSALLLSGGATLGFHHLGVVKALFEADALPTVLGGASMGAMIAAGIATRTDDELFEAALRDASALLSVPVTAGDVVDWDVVRWGGALPFASLGHKRRVAEVRGICAADGTLAVVGGWLSGNGLAAIVADTPQQVRTLLS